MAKNKKKKKKNSSKARYDAKKKSLTSTAKLHDNITLKAQTETGEAESDKVAPPSEELCTATVEAATDITESKAESALADSTEVASYDTKAESEAEAEEKPETEDGQVQAADQSKSPAPAAEIEPPVLLPIEQVDIPYDPDFSEDDFFASVNELKAEDIDMPEEKQEQIKSKKKLSKAVNVLQISILVICGAVAVVCMFLLGENIWGKIKGKEIYSDVQSKFDGFTLEDSVTDLRDLAFSGSDAPLQTLSQRVDGGKSDAGTNNQNQYKEQLSQMKASLSALKAKHKDIYGWIYVPDSNINHPVVKCDDNNYYLDHAPTGDFLPIGSIFADLTTKELLTDNFNTVLYGHNVVAGGESSMFHDVEKFLDPEFFKDTKIYVYTLDGAFIFEPVSIYDTVADDFYFKTVFSSEADFLYFAKEKVSASNIYSGAVFSSGDKMLTLSTCTNGAQDGRYALHAKLVEVIQ